MAFLTNIGKTVSKIISTDVFGFKTSIDSAEEQMAIFPDWLFSSRLGQPRNVNIPELRKLAKSSWIQMVENTLRKEVMTIPLELINVDDEDDNEHTDIKNEIQDFFDNINEDGQTIIDLCIESISDIAEIDSGVWNKVFNMNSYAVKQEPVLNGYGQETQETVEQLVLKPFGQRKLAGVKAQNGGSFLKNVDVYKRLLGYYQYSYRFPRWKPKYFSKDEIVFMIMNKRADSVYGFSPLQSVQQVIELLINSVRWNKDFFKSNMIPPAIVSLPGADPSSMKKLKKQWASKVKGRGHELLFQNTDAKVQSLITSPRDLEFLDGQKWYFHLAFGVYGMSPTEVGFHENVNRSSQEGQERVTVKNAIKPFLTLFENAINRHIIPELLQEEKPLVKAMFRPKDHTAEKIEHEQNMAELDRNVLSVNEFRKMKGRQAVPGGDLELDKEPEMDPKNDPKNDSVSEKYYKQELEKFVSR